MKKKNEMASFEETLKEVAEDEVIEELDEDEEYEDEDYSEEVAPPMSIDEALDKFQVIDKGMYTRQYLYETFIRVFDRVT